MKIVWKIESLFSLFFLAQTLLGIRVLWRMWRSAGGERILPSENTSEERIAIIVPVLNEEKRLAPCLDGLLEQGEEVVEIIIVDGGSTDGTQALIQSYAQLDRRIRLLDASPVPPTWNGKAWGLHTGLQAACPSAGWLLTNDADVRPAAGLARALLARALRDQLAALSVATLQEINGIGQGLLHPSMLTTLVYRFGIPGKTFRHASEVQANGQCFLVCRNALTACNGFLETRSSVCEDVTLARLLVNRGYRVGFYEAGALISVDMYRGWRDTWHNWTRSLPMHDHLAGIHTLAGWLEVLLVQALPLPLLILAGRRRRELRWPLLLNTILLATRIGVLFGTARAYRQCPWSYWLSPLCDLPVAIELGVSALRRRHRWRGRTLIRGGLYENR